MTSLIKNQILKHLTKFFKDLAPEQLQLSAFKGSCELSNLQLEEKVLMELLSFPAWVRINKAVCDQLSIKIPWTKIKSVPIQMNLNEVTVEVEVCDEFCDPNESNANATGSEADNLTNLINSAAPAGKYGFVDRVIDGITVTVNNVLITFKSKLMSATFNLSRVLLESRCPNWKPGELSLTKIKDVNRSQILLFKIVEWQNMRLEAKCLTDPLQAPLRLITNHAQCRLTIKKNLEDCSVAAARIFVIFEDILWVLTFAQFISAASFVEYIFTLIKKSPISKKTGIFDDHSVSSQTATATNTSSSQNNTSVGSINSSSKPMNTSQAAAVPPPLMPSSLNSSVQSNYSDKAPILTGNLSSASLIEQKFLCYDLLETSLHLYIDKVDAHLYDDIEISPTGSNNKSNSNRDSGGALQTTLDRIQVDCYPYSRANSDREHWYRWFDPSPSSRKQWSSSHFAEFDLAQRQKIQDQQLDCDGFNNKTNNSILTPVPTALNDQLLSLTVLVKIKDYCMNCVATKQSMRGFGGLNKFIQTDKDYHMPSDMPSLYLELNYFYYFDAINRMMVYENVPDPLAFVHLSPTKLLFDSPTLLFLNSFQVNLSKALVLLNDLFPEETTAPKIHCRVEILMPQVSLPAKPETNSKSENSGEFVNQSTNIATTSTLLLKSGKVTLSNSIYDKNVLAKLLASIDILKENPSQPINLSGYQSNQSGKRDNSCTGDWNKVWNASLINKMSDFNLQNQLWAMQFEPVWMDFMNYDVDDLSTNQRLEPIVEPVHAYAFVHLNLSSPASQKRKSSMTSSSKSDKLESSNHVGDDKRDIISILVTVMDGSILANMDKVQFSFLQRLGMHVEKLFQQIREDASSIIQLDTTVEGSFEVNLTAYIKDIKARLILEKKIEKHLTMVDFDSSYEKDRQSEQQQTTTTNTLRSSEIKPIAVETILDTNRYFMDINPSSLNPFSKNQQIPTDQLQDERILGVVYNPGETSDSIADDMALDECTEVADDASCLILGNNNNKSESSGNANGEPSVSSLSISNTAESSEPKRKSPIDENLLINLDEIEQSSSLFAKVNLKPAPSPKPPQQQQQETETQSISYLELSMSQLMVRRITETKRRQKF